MLLSGLLAASLSTLGAGTGGTLGPLHLLSGPLGLERLHVLESTLLVGDVGTTVALLGRALAAVLLLLGRSALGADTTVGLLLCCCARGAFTTVGLLDGG